MVKHVISCILQPQNILRDTLIFFMGFWFLQNLLLSKQIQIEALKFMISSAHCNINGETHKESKDSKKVSVFYS